MVSSRTGLLLLSVVLFVAFDSGAGAEGPSSAAVGAPRPSTIVMTPPTPSSTETPLAAPPPAPAPASDVCMDLIMANLFACLTFVEDGSNMTRPDDGCCQGLSTVVNTNVICLCSLVSSTEIVSVAINSTKSLMLPAICRVQTPPISLCAVIAGNTPASSPAGSPSGDAPPLGPTLPAAAGAATPAAAGAATPAASPPAPSSADPRFASSGDLVLLAGLALATFAMF